MLRRFYIERDEDINGKSGVGRVAEGVEYDNAWVAWSFLGPRTAVYVTNSISNVEYLHSHGGKASNARIVWIDEYDEDTEEKVKKIKTQKIKELLGENGNDEAEPDQEEPDNSAEDSKA